MLFCFCFWGVWVVGLCVMTVGVCVHARDVVTKSDQSLSLLSPPSTHTHTHTPEVDDAARRAEGRRARARLCYPSAEENLSTTVVHDCAVPDALDRLAEQHRREGLFVLVVVWLAAAQERRRAQRRRRRACSSAAWPRTAREAGASRCLLLPCPASNHRSTAGRCTRATLSLEMAKQRDGVYI